MLFIHKKVIKSVNSRRWSREQKTVAGMGSPVFGYMATGGSTVKTPAVGSPPYQVSLEDRLRWAQIADVMVQANHYAVSIKNDTSSTPLSQLYLTLKLHYSVHKVAQLVEALC